MLFFLAYIFRVLGNLQGAFALVKSGKLCQVLQVNYLLPGRKSQTNSMLHGIQFLLPTSVRTAQMLYSPYFLTAFARYKANSQCNDCIMIVTSNPWNTDWMDGNSLGKARETEGVWLPSWMADWHSTHSIKHGVQLNVTHLAVTVFMLPIIQTAGRMQKWQARFLSGAWIGVESILSRALGR